MENARASDGHGDNAPASGRKATRAMSAHGDPADVPARGIPSDAELRAAGARRVERIGDAVLVLGDCREVAAQFGMGTVDAVVTNPPYGINTKSDGMGKLSPWGDWCNAAFWYADWLATLRYRVKPDGCVWSFLNWRSLVTFQKAACDIKWPIESLLIWDKDWIGPGGPKGLRPCYEMVALFAGESFAIPDRSLRDIQTFQWSANKPSGHPAEKPEALIGWLVSISTAPGAVVVDPFMGSGTTGCAALRSGRRFIGIEIDDNWFDLSCRRVAEAARQPSLFDAAPQPKAEQLALGYPVEQMS